jgi:hypothetical protein
LNKRVFYYSVELFCLILLDYSVWKMYQTNFFHFFRNGIFLKAPVAHELSSLNMHNYTLDNLHVINKVNQEKDSMKRSE